MKAPEQAADLTLLSDEELVLMCREDDRQADEELYSRYKKIVRTKARPYFLIGADREDLVQEGMIGLYKAVRDYNADKQATFHSFAEICIARQIITAVKASTRQKHIPLNSYVSLFRPVIEGEQDRSLIDVLTPQSSISPEDMLIGQEEISSLRKKLFENLSPLECKVVSLYLEGQSYQDIADELACGIKAVDNALQRIKKKMEQKLLSAE